jgi:hypothetical protein
MNKQMKEQTRRIVPGFATETEEAEWWYKNATPMARNC